MESDCVTAGLEVTAEVRHQPTGQVEDHQLHGALLQYTDLE